MHEIVLDFALSVCIISLFGRHFSCRSMSDGSLPLSLSHRQEWFRFWVRSRDSRIVRIVHSSVGFSSFFLFCSFRVFIQRLFFFGCMLFAFILLKSKQRHQFQTVEHYQWLPSRPIKSFENSLKPVWFLLSSISRSHTFRPPKESKKKVLFSLFLFISISLFCIQCAALKSSNNGFKIQNHLFHKLQVALLMTFSFELRHLCFSFLHQWKTTSSHTYTQWNQTNW